MLSSAIKDPSLETKELKMSKRQARTRVRQYESARSGNVRADSHPRTSNQFIAADVRVRWSSDVFHSIPKGFYPEGIRASSPGLRVRALPWETGPNTNQPQP